MDPIVLIIIAVIVVLVIGAIAIYNSLVQKRLRIDEAFAQIEVQLKRRHDLIPNLVNAVKGAMEFERDTLTRVMEARAKAVSATTPAAAARAEGELTQALGRLFALAENYPSLKANENVKMLQEELSSTENKIGFARQFYNDIATSYNNARETFPSNMIASSMGFKPAELFELTDEAERAVPAVDLTMKQ